MKELLEKERRLDELQGRLDEFRQKNLEVEKKCLELEKQCLDLKKQNKQKDNLFSLIAHDLKTPFNFFLGFLELLMRKFGKLSEEGKKRYIENIYVSAKDTFYLLENILSWSRFQMGRLPYSPKSVDLKKEVDTVINFLKYLSEKKKIEIINNIAGGTVLGDSFMLSTILRNLISNSLKFTKQKGIIVVSAEISVINANVKISVTDNGIGIRPEDCKKLFKADQFFSTSSTEGEKGTGLGLLICRRMVEKMNGRIWVESEGIGKGSKFTFSLPLA